jgi:hypothetical protein
MTRIARRTALVLSAIALTAPAAAFAQAAKEIRVDWATYNPVSMLLKDKGFLEKEFAKDGVTIRWVQTVSSSNALQFLNASSIDFGSTAGSAALVAKINGNPIKSVYTYSRPEWTALENGLTQAQINDACKQVVVSFPNLEVGDVIEVFWTVSGRHPEFQDQFFYRYTFGNDKYPTLRDEWTVRLPKERTLRFESINGAVPVTTTEDRGRRQTGLRADLRIHPASSGTILSEGPGHARSDRARGARSRRRAEGCSRRLPLRPAVPEHARHQASQARASSSARP